jgi:hypothetical protein
MGLTFLAALLPVVSEGVKTIINRFFGSAQPKTVDDVLKLKEAELRHLEALAQLDKVDGAAKWVNTLRGAIRPCATILLLGVWAVASFTNAIPEAHYVLIADLASAAMFYLFGERSMMYIKRSK